MIDRYTKVILTVIALALTALVLRPLFELPSATAQGSRCGDIQNPCFVTANARTALPVLLLNK